MNYYIKWKEHVGITDKEAASRLDIAPQTIARLKPDANWDDVRTRLAMAALSAGLEPWSPDNAHEPDALKPVLEAIRSASEKRDG
ncbi:MAG: hypothetical protein AAF468_20090 [Pseudomonadota bacterium]